MHPCLSRGLAGCLLVVSSGAAAQVGDEEPAALGDSFWAEVVHPHRARYGQLVAQGATLLAGGDPAAAAAALEQAVRLDLGEPLGFYLLGLARYRTHAWSGCADALAVVETLRPGYAPAAGTRLDASSSVGGTLGLCYLHAGRFDEAAAHYRRMLGAGEPGASPDALHNSLGDCYQALGRLDDAIEEYQLAAAAAPRAPLPLFGLAAALDRDDQVACAHEALARALALDPQLAALAGATFMPPEDVHYHYGLAFQAASATDPLRRLPALVRFRRYLGLAGPAPWARRARAHLAELGSPSITAADVLVSPAEGVEREAVVRAVVAAGPELQRCMGSERNGAVRATLRVHPAGEAAAAAAPRPTPAGRVRPQPLRPEGDRASTLALDTEPVGRQTIECIDRVMRGLKVKVGQLTLVQVPVTALPP